MKRFCILLSVCFLASTAWGTAQAPEKILYKGKEYRLTCFPLEEYFDANHPKPKEFRPTSTACWRGYIGTWEIKQKALYLKSLGRDRSELDRKTLELKKKIEKIPLSLVFKDRKPPIKATWYSGALRIPQGRMLRGGYSSFSAIYERDLYIGVKAGEVISEHLVDNKGKGATLSRADLQWMALASKPVKDDFKWHDARVVASDAFAEFRESGKLFRTRGMYCKDPSRFQLYRQATTEPVGIPAKLMIHSTPTTPTVVISLKSTLDHRVRRSGEHVEIKAHFEKEPDGYFLRVDSMRPLKRGETMHHPDFKPPDKSAKP